MKFWVEKSEDHEGLNYLYCDKFPQRMSWKRAKELSIQKWEAVVELGKTEEDITNNDGNSCGLCEKAGRVSNEWGERVCSVCPVYKLTGEVACKGTPWDRFCKASEEDDVPAALRAARAEVRFLKKLEVK